MSAPIYTPEELQGKFIVSFVLLSGKRPARDCVRYNEGPRKGLPYLYNSMGEAKTDQNFETGWDEVMEASEFFKLDAQN
jgi:hypothetical protein